MSLSQFLLVCANVYFFLGLGLYVQMRNGPIFALSSLGALFILLGAWWPEAHTDGLVAAFFPGAVALVYLVGAMVCFGRSEIRPDFWGKGLAMVLISAVGLAGAACALLLEWPHAVGP
ncbi:MAG: hypothetical protein SFU85_11895 [Candidatus Methylacidiphilales bacterium]|nr:hypothetical protein [Candidatus Methylacidiphilales bacterium]